RKTTYYVSQGRAIRCMVALFTNLEDLIAKNDRRYEEHTVDNTTEYVVPFILQDHMQCGYITLAQVLPWIHPKLSELDSNDSEDMLKKGLRRGADVACGDDTSTLKDLIAAWVNQDFRLSYLLKADDKHSCGFIHETCGRLLCPAEWDWSDARVKAGIHDRTSQYIVSENSWPLFLYKNYSINSNNLEKGLFKSKILVQAFKATFTSPSSTREANILENNRRARHALNHVKVHFTLSGVRSWRTMDGDFDYEMFWNNIMDFFEDVPGPVA
ncbi:uncharacterized protein EDB91DRAFT_1046108, partial [Suillus paluster]|uniref:uncharacterized protein n=1 Tax=Suillus paluster TaxID=48578 RepID=UPI001B881BB9